MLFSVGFGFTVTVTSCVFEHPFAVSVNVYFTAIDVAVVLVSVSLMLPVWSVFAVSVMPGTMLRDHFIVVLAVPLDGVL
jgi:hypothetical protein